MNRKKWAALTLSLLGLSIGGTVALVAAVDPFEVYHRATAFIPPISNGTQIYSNAGIAKNYAYDSVVIGSSMTENFRPSQLDRLFGGQFVKLCVNAGSSFNHKQMMDMAFATHDVRRVLYGVDVEAAHRLGLRAWREPGLPGRYCPESAALAIAAAFEKLRKGGNEDG